MNTYMMGLWIGVIYVIYVIFEKENKKETY